ncbi:MULTISPECIES: hypothetical protein [Luteibacter]|uniref:hypothetical protein n=1 Tax=Luteibacter TaxID=242605 RepID=UPI000A93E418|nr:MULTISPECIES: hypothetical protein [unclassified Luteibacter]
MIDNFARECIVSLAEDCETALRMELVSLDAQDFECASIHAEAAERTALAAFRIAKS